MELLNLLSLPDPAPTLARMAELGITAVILPEADPAALAALVAQERQQAIAPDPIRRLAALLPADVPLAEAIAARFRLSGAQKRRLALTAARQTTEAAPRAMAYRLGIEVALDRLLIAGRDVSTLRDWAIPAFPLKGGQIVAAGVKAGPEVARTLQAVEARWLAEQFPDETRVLAILDEELAARS